MNEAIQLRKSRCPKDFFRFVTISRVFVTSIYIEGTMIPRPWRVLNANNYENECKPEGDAGEGTGGTRPTQRRSAALRAAALVLTPCAQSGVEPANDRQLLRLTEPRSGGGVQIRRPGLWRSIHLPIRTFPHQSSP